MNFKEIKVGDCLKVVCDEKFYNRLYKVAYINKVTQRIKVYSLNINPVIYSIIDHYDGQYSIDDYYVVNEIKIINHLKIFF